MGGYGGDGRKVRAIFCFFWAWQVRSSSANGEQPNAEPSSSSGNAANLCAGVEYDASVYRCENGELIGKCKGVDFYPAYQVCNNGVIEDKDPSNPTPSSSSYQSSSSSISPSQDVSSSSVSSSSGDSFSSSSSAQSSSSSRVCSSNDLGKGYDVIGSPYINWTEVFSIAALDQDRMCQDGILELDKPGGAQQYAIFSGSTVKEFYSKRNESMKISANLGVDIDIAFVFSAKLDAKFAMKTSSSSQQSQSLKYFYSQIRSYRYTGEDQIKSGSASAQNLSKYLTSSFISDLKSSKTAGQILDLYGSHIFIHYYKGGSLEANYTYRGTESSSRFTSASQMEAAVKGSFAKKIDIGISGGTSNSNDQAIEELEKHMSFNYEIYGGKGVGATSIEQLMSEYDSWVSSIASNARTTGIKDFAQSFIPIWDLAQHVEGVTSARINALKDEFKRRANEQGKIFDLEEIDIPCTPDDNSSTNYCSNGFLKEYGRISFGGTTYKTVVIGSQTWMAENLRGGIGGWGCFEEPYDGSNDVCPSGWHLPNSGEWDILTSFVETDSKCFNCAGKKLKAKKDWNNNGNGTDDYGFSALPKGYIYNPYEPEFDKGDVAVWWVNSCSETFGFCDHRAIISGSDDIFHFELSPNTAPSPNNVVSDGWYSVRCVKD
ncbi:hypothetical protein R83H12_00391 [Fibrobacteria bacterium R8-3-H12]